MLGYLEYSNLTQHIDEYGNAEQKKHQFQSTLADEEPLVETKSIEEKNDEDEKDDAAINRKVLEAYGVTAKVMEQWLNDTLSDAQHLDIPGVILQPEHKNPVSRYGIDRIELTNSGIPNEMVDRIYRSLFVYSVGFFEML